MQDMSFEYSDGLPAGQAATGKTCMAAVIAAEEKVCIVEARQAQIAANNDEIAILGLAAAQAFRQAREIPLWFPWRYGRVMKQVEFMLGRIGAIQQENDALALANARDTAWS
jgi:hypothetical protein